MAREEERLRIELELNVYLRGGDEEWGGGGGGCDCVAAMVRRGKHREQVSLVLVLNVRARSIALLLVLPLPTTHSHAMRASLAALARRQLAAGRWLARPAATATVVNRYSPQPRRHSSTATSITPHHGWLAPRTHNAGDLRSSHIGQEVTLAGWLVQNRKPSAHMSFYPLRDSTGQVQLVMEGADDKPLMAVPRESVVHVHGLVRRRPDDGVRSDQPTGQVEVLIKSWTLLNPASTALPFHPGDEYKLPNDEFRAKHRYLDLRRPTLTENIRLRSRVAHRVRCYLHDRGGCCADGGVQCGTY